MGEKKFCKKCLLAELDNEKLLAEVKRAVSLISSDLRSSDKLYDERLSICTQCDYLNEGTCGACGCYVELRAATNISHCPYKKW